MKRRLVGQGTGEYRFACRGMADRQSFKPRYPAIPQMTFYPDFVHVPLQFVPSLEQSRNAGAHGASIAERRKIVITQRSNLWRRIRGRRLLKSSRHTRLYGRNAYEPGTSLHQPGQGVGTRCGLHWPRSPPPQSPGGNAIWNWELALEQIQLTSTGGSFGAAIDLKLAVDIATVLLDGIEGDCQAFSDLPV